ncbi:hypothetical protein ACFYVL_32265 [Streptomyces sp. NPDC004111]|uniref:hypothetical protein n=1 Tax=Streptomyces sp. NPDC004111 TaxID=3364690 RepID=UPI003685CD77
MSHSVEERRIVELLARGWGDEKISRELALSVRTVQRRIGQLMDEYRCASRFALGFKLGRHRLNGST